MRHLPSVYEAQLSHHRSTVLIATWEQHDVNTFVKGRSSSPKSHEIVLPLFAKYQLWYLICFPYDKILLKELVQHLSPRSNGVRL
jgi:hypothetical protein